MADLREILGSQGEESASGTWRTDRWLQRELGSATHQCVLQIVLSLNVLLWRLHVARRTLGVGERRWKIFKRSGCERLQESSRGKHDAVGAPAAVKQRLHLQARTVNASYEIAKRTVEIYMRTTNTKM